MALTPILDMQADVTPFFGVSIDDNAQEYALLDQLRKYVEMAARKFVRHGIAQATYTEFQRKTDIATRDMGNASWELIGSKVYNTTYESYQGEYLQLDNVFARSITTLHEDSNARFGAGSGDFGASTLLTNGTDYHLELDSSTMSRSGRVVRIGRSWSSRPGTIKIVYVAGFTAAELNDEYSFVKMALLEDIAEKFNMGRSQRASAFGPVKKETYFGDYQVEYAVDTKALSVTSLSRQAMSALSPIKAYIL